MRRAPAFLPVLLFLSLHAGLAFADEWPGADDPEARWTTLETERFTLISQLPDEATVVLARSLLTYHNDVIGEAEHAYRGPPLRLKVILFAHPRDDYRTGKHLAYLQPGTGVTHLVVFGGSPSLLREQYAYFVLGLRYRHLPLWLQVGLKSFLTAYSRSDDGFDLGYPHSIAIGRVQARKFFPFERFVELEQRSPEFLVDDPGDAWRRFEDQAFCAVHYLMMEAEGGEAMISRYLEYLDVGIDEGEAFRAAYGELPTDLGIKIRAHADSEDPKYHSFSVPEPTFDLATPRPMSRPEVLAELGELQLAVARGQSGAKRNAFETLAIANLQAALSLGPELASGHRGLGLVARLQKDDEAALEHFSLAVERDPTDSYGHYLLAESLMGPFQRRAASLSLRLFTEPPAALVKAREHLGLCLKIRPGYVDALSLLS